jgi:hypothetical protein
MQLRQVVARVDGLDVDAVVVPITVQFAPSGDTEAMIVLPRRARRTQYGAGVRAVA